ncbi:hypothetical protein AAFF_G00358820 [Aldrovandia affinis]|uniref:Uncharacterized protein n=1 Tax=Aldrovandia affinis TaxID=143900 RepID=A0AAD7SK47_9TELE|nr:hypothetical protein AAFF_G00358820 [Aldrovandia affinis]
MRIIERFMILLYDRTSKCTDIDKARRKLFARKNNVQLIPPTKAALEEYVKRAVYQGLPATDGVMNPIKMRPSAVTVLHPLPLTLAWSWSIPPSLSSASSARPLGSAAPVLVATPILQKEGKKRGMNKKEGG